MPRGVRWQKYEELILSENYSKIGVSGIKTLLPHRSEKALNIKASRMGLKLDSAWNKKINTSEYIEKLRTLNIKYTPIEEYINDATEILHKCPRCSYPWKVRPNNIINGSGCPKCNKGFAWDSTSTNAQNTCLYLLKINIGIDSILKVGVSTNIKKRIKQIKYELGGKCTSIELLRALYDTAPNILLIEKQILEVYKNTYSCPYNFKGHTETLHISNLEEVSSILLDYILET